MSKKERDLEADFNGLEKLLRVTLTVHDQGGIFRDAADVHLLSLQMTAHQHPECRRRRDEKRCVRDCQQGANAHVRKTGRPYVHVCWKGIAEVVVPVIRENVHVATIFAGAFRKSKGGPGPELPVLDRKRAADLGRALTIFGQGIISRVEEMRRLRGKGGGREGQIRRFLMYQAHRGVRLADLARVLHLSPSRTSHVVKKLFGVSFRRLLLLERLSRARTLLLTRDHSVGEVARLVGFEDEYHFNHAFKNVYKLPPGRFRRRYRVGR